jgi:protein-disulfide isomerase
VTGRSTSWRFRAATAITAAVLTTVLSSCGDGAGDALGVKDKQKDSGATKDAEQPSAKPGSVIPLEPADAEVLAGLPAKLGADGSRIVVGKDSAKNTVTVLEDARCPFCKQFEATNGAQLAKAAAAGQVKIEYVVASFLDQALGGGSGSHNSANAMRAALQAGKFPQFHALIFRNQPKETVDSLTDEYLLKLAGQVDGLRSKTFDRAVVSDQYKDFVTAAQEAFKKSGAQGTPTVKLNGKPLPGETMMNAAAFAKALKAGGA